VASKAPDAMTVAELKEALRARGLPVTGRKAELLERLAGTGAPKEAPTSSVLPPVEPTSAPEAAAPTAVPMGTVDVTCASCGQRLSLPASHKGRFQCPTCGSEQDMDSATPATGPVEALSERYASTRTIAHRINMAGIAVGILAVIVFFAGMGQLGPDPENCQEIEYEGEMEMSCTGGGFIENPEALNYVGVACCLLVPLAIGLPIFGQAIRPPALVTQHASYGADGTEATAPVVEGDSPVQRLVGAVSLLFGGSLVVATVVLAIAVVILFILALMALGSMG